MRCAAAAIFAATAALAATAHAQAPAPGPAPPRGGLSPQEIFTRLILDDKDTSSTVVSELRSKRVFVDPQVVFADVTGDRKADGIAQVDSGGASGTIAVYVFSSDGVKPGADGKSALRAIYRSQSLYRATVRTTGTTLLVRTPIWKGGDEICCPSSQKQRNLTWSARAKKLVLRSTASI